MVQQDKCDIFDVPQISFRPLSSGRVRWKSVILGVVCLCLGSGLSYWYYLHYQGIVAKQKKNQETLLDADQVASRFILEDSYEGEYCVDEALINNPNKRFDISAVKRELGKMEKNPVPLVKAGNYHQISSPQGIYHIVVGSFLDRASAKKFVHQLMKEKRGIMFIVPPKEERYYRVTIEQSATLGEAEKKLQVLKSIYGRHIWILKY